MGAEKAVKAKKAFHSENNVANWFKGSTQTLQLYTKKALTKITGLMGLVVVSQDEIEAMKRKVVNLENELNSKNEKKREVDGNVIPCTKNDNDEMSNLNEITKHKRKIDINILESFDKLCDAQKQSKPTIPPIDTKGTYSQPEIIRKPLLFNANQLQGVMLKKLKSKEEDTVPTPSDSNIPILKNKRPFSINDIKSIKLKPVSKLRRVSKSSNSKIKQQSTRMSFGSILRKGFANKFKNIENYEDPNCRNFSKMNANTEHVLTIKNDQQMQSDSDADSSDDYFA